MPSLQTLNIFYYATLMNTVTFDIDTHFPDGLSVKQLRKELIYENQIENTLIDIRTAKFDLIMTFENSVDQATNDYLTGTLFPNHIPPDIPTIDDPDIFASSLYIDRAISKSETYRGSITHKTGLTFEANGIEYIIGKDIHRINKREITLDTADPTNPRIDIICANELSKLVKISGTPAESPMEPTTPIDMVKLVTVSVSAGQTMPDLIVDNMYDENLGSIGGEWDVTETTSGDRINLDNVQHVLTGSKSISFTNAKTDDCVIFTSSTEISSISFDSLTFGVYIPSELEDNIHILIRPMLNDQLLGRTVNATEPITGFNRKITGVYQELTIPISDFSLVSSTFNAFDFCIVTKKDNMATFYIDKVRLQKGVVAAIDSIVNPQYSIGNEYEISGQISGTLSQGNNATQIRVGPAGQVGFIDEHSISGALARVAANFSPGTPITIIVLPGIYVETEQMIIPANVTIKGEKANNCVVTCTDPTATLFKLRAGSVLNNIHITGLSGSGGTAILFDSTLDDGSPTPVRLRALAGGLLITNCETGIKVIPKTPLGFVSMLLINETLFAASNFSPVQTVGTAIRVEGGGLLHISDSGTQEFGPIQIPVALDISGTGSDAAAIGVVFRGCGVACRTRDGAKIRVSSSAIRACTAGATVDGEGTTGTFQGLDVADITNKCFTVSNGAVMNVTSTNIDNCSSNTSIFESVGTSDNVSTMVLSAISVHGPTMTIGIDVQEYSLGFISSTSIKASSSIATGIKVSGTGSNIALIGTDIINPIVGFDASDTAIFSAASTNIIDCSGTAFVVKGLGTIFTASGNNIRGKGSGITGAVVTDCAQATVSTTTLTGSVAKALDISVTGTVATATDLTVHDADTGIVIASGARLDMASINLYNCTNKFIDITGTGSIGTVSGGSFINGVTAVSATTGTMLSIASVKISNMSGTVINVSGNNAKFTGSGLAIDGGTKGIIVNDTATVLLSGSRITGCDTALEVGSTGTTTKLRATSLEVDNCTVDLDIKPDDADIQIVWGVIDKDKLINPNDVSFGVAASSSKPGDEAIYIGSELHVGTADHPRESAFGGGDSYTLNMKVFTETSGNVFTDFSSEAASQGGSTFAGWSEASSGACLYIGGPRKFEGIKMLSGNISPVPTDVLDDSKITIEFWNGSTWEAITRMATNAVKPYNSTRTQILSNVNYAEQIRFGFRKDTLDTWVRNTVNSVELFWVRLRQVSAITGEIPIIEQIKLHIGRFEINSDGFTERFGGVIRELPWDWGMTEPANSSPSDQDTYLTSTINVGRRENEFVNNTTDRAGFNITLPAGIDTSKGIRFNVPWFKRGGQAGDVKWIIRYAITNAGSKCYPSNPGSGAYSTEKEITYLQTVADLDDTIFHFDPLYLDISDYNPRPTTGDPDRLWVTIQRSGSDSADTINTSVYIVNIRASYIEVFDGGHPDLF